MRALSCTSVLIVAALAAGVYAAPPTTAAVKPAKDVIKGAVDPYDPGAERTRFFKAAGVDNELSAKEFAAAKGKKDSFVRPFDNWQAMLAFDKDHNQTLDWFEVQAYRQSVRDRVLKAFDADKDNQLKGAEREKANAALAAGQLPSGTATAGATGRHIATIHAGSGASSPATAHGAAGRTRGAVTRARSVWSQTNKEMLEKYDADKDGKLSSEEHAARNKDLMEQWRIKRHDKDGDGKLNDTERAAMEAEKARWDEQMKRYREQAEQRQKEMLAKYDTDGDGKMSNDENQAMYKDMRQQWLIKQHDKDGDGQLNEAEQAAMEVAKARQERQIRAGRKYWEEQKAQVDTNGDGQTSAEEWQVYRKKNEAKYDADGDGKLSIEERQAMNQAVQDRWLIIRHDEDEDGKLNDKERAAMEAEKARWAEQRRVWRERAEKMRRDADSDGDGKVSAEEWREYYKKRGSKASPWGQGGGAVVYPTGGAWGTVGAAPIVVQGGRNVTVTKGPGGATTVTINGRNP